MDKYAVFILSNRRPNRVITYNSLRKQGYTGPIYIIVDSEDPTIDEYKAQYGDEVIVFDKAAVSPEPDKCNNFSGRRGVIYARNACFGIARSLGYRYFLELDDDYGAFQYRLTAELTYGYARPRSLDKLFSLVFDFYASIPALTIALAQSGDLIGGGESRSLKKLWLKRKAMNSFFCSTDRPFEFIGQSNEDATMYAVYGHRGQLIFTIFNCSISQAETQTVSGGMTDLYKDFGTYVKSFYTLMNAPSCVKIAAMQTVHTRIHHALDWDHACPVILDASCRKE